MLASLRGAVRARNLVAVALAVVAGCASPAPGGSPPAARHDVQGAAGAVARAQGLFYGNRYTDAEAAFREATAKYPWYAEAHAALALFLNYEHLYGEAAGEVAEARSLDPRSAYAAAVDTRVHDWSARDAAGVREAAGIGAAAVALGPRAALTHTFYAEALSDSGDAGSARRELDTATGLAASPYERSEVEREKANLSLNTGDKATQLAHLQASVTIQPGWAERTRELAEYYFVNDQEDQAVALVRKAIALAPGDASLRLTLGSEALLRQDIPLADESFTAASTLKPHDPAVESTLAMTHFTLHHDVAEAERLLRAATADAPGDLEVASLLEGFLRYVKNDPAGAAAVTAGPPPREPINPRAPIQAGVAQARQEAAQGALDAVNAARAQAHLAPVHLDARISNSATSHAYWWLFNLSLPDVKGLGIHHEVAGTPGFTGVTMRDRATRFGYPQASMAEDITHRGEPAPAIKDWVDSVYHRFPLMIPTLDAVGFGEATGGDLPIDVLDMAYRNEVGDLRSMVAFPADGQNGVPTSFLGNELPDPVPTGGQYPTGYPITVNFNPYTTVAVTTSQVRDTAGTPVDSYILPPVREEENVLTLLPKAPLTKATSYRVHVAGSIDGAAFALDFSFTTES